MKSLLREPLVHFLITGAALFVFRGYYGGVDVSDRQITLDEAQVTRLTEQWQQTWRRAPTTTELDGLIRDHIKEEVYSREALRLGLDVDDPIIRRRLRAKMEFIATAEVENADPSDTEFKRYYTENKARYAADPNYDFDQRFYGDNAADARKALPALKAGSSPASVNIPLPAAMEEASTSDIAKTFGDGFAESMRLLPMNMWSGPVQSGYGWHVVRVRRVEASKVPPLADIKQRVTNDWRAETRAKREAAAYQALLDGYDIRIAKP